MDDITAMIGRTQRRLLVAGAALLVAGGLAASLPFASAVEPRSFSTPELSERYRSLVEEIRCLVCQNQSIADSNADLARDLRGKVDELLRAGRSDEEILDYMVDRYGNFVRYRPPFDPTTIVLWVGPFALAGVAFGWLLIRIRRRVPGKEALSTAERTRLARILGSESEQEQERMD